MNYLCIKKTWRKTWSENEKIRGNQSIFLKIIFKRHEKADEKKNPDRTYKIWCTTVEWKKGSKRASWNSAGTEGLTGTQFLLQSYKSAYWGSIKERRTLIETDFKYLNVSYDQFGV